MNWIKKLFEEDEGFSKRFIMVILGLVLGTVFVIASTAFKNENASIAMLVFGCVTYGCFLIGALVDYVDW